MNSEHEKQLEAAISRELKSLPEMAAPDTITRRVMSAIKECPGLPWYRRSWQTWPLGLRSVSLVVMLVLFGGLCFAGWKLSHAQTIASALHRLGEFASGLKSAGSIIAVLLNSMALAVKKLGTGFMAAGLLSILLAYAMCVGLGTVYVRLITTRVLNLRN